MCLRLRIIILHESFAEGRAGVELLSTLPILRMILLPTSSPTSTWTDIGWGVHFWKTWRLGSSTDCDDTWIRARLVGAVVGLWWVVDVGARKQIVQDEKLLLLLLLLLSSSLLLLWNHPSTEIIAIVITSFKNSRLRNYAILSSGRTWCSSGGSSCSLWLVNFVFGLGRCSWLVGGGSQVSGVQLCWYY
jgi:hypothetical protein